MNDLSETTEQKQPNIIVGIDTSGKIASIAISDGKCILASTTVVTKLTHSQILLPLLKKLLEDACLTLDDIDAFAVAKGPGSYTGLRIGISAVKGLCFKDNKMCAGISTLKSLAMNLFTGEAREKIVFSVMKARPEISYFGVYKLTHNSVEVLLDDAVCENKEILTYKNSKSFSEVILVGDNAEKIKSSLFENDDSVITAPPDKRLQNSASLCVTAINDKSVWGSASELNAGYLQITKAEKDRKMSE